MLLTISGLLTLTVIAYLGYEACIYHTTDSTLEDFLEVYLNNPQKYIFNGMIYGIPAIYSNVLFVFLFYYSVFPNSSNALFSASSIISRSPDPLSLMPHRCRMPWMMTRCSSRS